MIAFIVLASRSTADEHPAATPGYPRRQASSYASPDEIRRVGRRCKLVRGALRRAKPVTCVAQIPRRQFICAPGKTWSNFKPNICSSWHKAGKWPLSNLVASYSGKNNAIRGFPHVSHAVDNRSRDNGSSCFSPRAYLLVFSSCRRFRDVPAGAEGGADVSRGGRPPFGP
jgi:hypothetical protein